MENTVHWAKYSKPIQENERTPDMHFQKTHYWVHLKWINSNISVKEWTLNRVKETHHSDLSKSEVDEFIQKTSKELFQENYTLADEGTYRLGAIDFHEIKAIIKRDTQKAFLEIQEKLETKTMCGFALFTDSSAMTLGASATTQEHIKNRDQMLSKDEAFFGVCEWELENDYKEPTFDFLESINIKTEWVTPFEPEINFNQYAASFLEACVSVLEELRNEGFFPKQDGQDFILLVDVMDDDPIKGMFLRLNPKRLYRRYKRATREPNFIESLWLDWKIKRHLFKEL